jgi:hypothetical protein
MADLSALELTLGKVGDAIRDSQTAVDHAERSGDAVWRRASRATRADTLHQASRCAEAEALFVEAEAIRAEGQPESRPLSSWAGFWYCDFRLAHIESAAWQRLIVPDGDKSLSTQYWTSRGIGVLDVNYRGSTSYGRAYRLQLERRWGVVDVEDCVAGARFLVENRSADPRRLMISGGSAGGYTTLRALTPEGERTFSGGASYYGVSDLEALARDTHKFESRYLDWLIGPGNAGGRQEDRLMAETRKLAATPPAAPP